MSGLQGLAQENIWFDKSRYDEAERHFYEGMNGIPQTSQSQNASKSEDQSELVSRLKGLELDNKIMHKVVDDLRATLSKLESRMAVLEKSQTPASKTVTFSKAAPVQKPKVEEHNGDDDDIDLFGSDEEDVEAERIKAERVKEYAQRKAKKPALIAKSSILLDVKPWDDETDMSKLEECVRSIQMDGLLWGASKLVPVGYGIKKLQISCVVEDDKVGTDILEEEITKFEDYIQSVDIAAFNKI
ncbi:eukaryotic translation elongation factor 1 delta a (guanine nucleotide exchange protein) isoform X8 [Onychostoma macrolepis]|nr:eukaryotic translation elongation factor 1 delta a (guanine nucleotide exchange protein) isoform X8 [Onychostoma macrolepis]